MGKKTLSSEFQPQARTVRWDAIKEDYIAQNLTRQKGQPAFTLQRCAEFHDVSYPYLRQIAGAQQWNKQLKERIRQRQAEVAQTIQSTALFDEIEIRTRHASYARLASSLAYQKLSGLVKKDIQKMSVKDAIELLRIGLAEEREAFGVGGAGTPPPPVEARTLSDQQVFAVARRLIDMKRGADGSYRAEDGA